ncbi:MAG TPA: cyclopropane-fatty-acyl-phospholipid synthase family protein, partial [Opitutus sp.]|nr:cyclopropane-fatty-acyl-phospholipid synthase family protein [Opitutus sp.]
MSITIASEVEQTIGLLRDLVGESELRNVSFKLWDGTLWPDAEPRAATIVFKHPGAVRAMFASGTEKGLGEAFLHDDFDVEGDIEAAFELVDVLGDGAQNGWLQSAKRVFQLYRPRTKLPPPRAWTERSEGSGRVHSRTRDRQAVSFHYDVSNDFYRLWLDPKMLYSCAYFERANDDLETAQLAKLNYLCRKLRLRPGQRLLDIGCGWGGLALHAAQNFGVRALGITLSTEQASLAAAKVRSAGLSDEVAIELKDYRDVEGVEGFDAIVSVGMAEHVGEKNLPVYFKKAYSLLKPGGVFLNHA